ncbi:MAG: hypothetical protein HWD59_03780 [Coxiellaceae bacterium]|nr:MAG: hypothetical protein HWD59_03780 [Coxiellaceae bacterium]
MYQFDKQLDQVSQFIKDESWLDATNELSRAISDHEKLSIIQVERFTALLNQVKRQSDITIQQKTETIYVELFMKQLSINRSGSKAFLQETASISQLLSDIAQVYEYLKQTEMAAWYASYALHQALWIKHQGLILQHQALLKDYN